MIASELRVIQALYGAEVKTVGTDAKEG